MTAVFVASLEKKINQHSAATTHITSQTDLRCRRVRFGVILVPTDGSAAGGL